MKSYLKVLLAQKEMREGRSISLRKVASESGVPISTVNGLANNTIKRIPTAELAALCEYLPCDLCDLLRLEPVQP